MLKEIYIDNFKCFKNFKISMNSINRFMGPTGAGKSSIFEGLYKLQMNIRGEKKIHSIFSHTELTRWQDSLIQTFCLEIKGNNGIYRYEISTEYLPEEHLTQIKHEELCFNNNPLIKFDAGRLQIFSDDHSKESDFQFDPGQSAISLLPSARNNRLLTWFKTYIDQKLIIVKINPTTMVSESAQEEKYLSLNMDNFSSWYRHISQDQGKAIEINHHLKEVIEGFNNFKFSEAGKIHRILEVVFSDTPDKNRAIEYQFHELSDGQRMLIVLYTIIYAIRSQGVTLCIDEPENFLALPEIQPWLLTLDDLCNAGEIQTLLISHHPQLIDNLAVSSGYWFERYYNGSAYVKRITEDDQSGLPISELVAAGWLYE